MARHLQSLPLDNKRYEIELPDPLGSTEYFLPAASLMLAQSRTTEPTMAIKLLDTAIGSADPSAAKAYQLNCFVSVSSSVGCLYGMRGTLYQALGNVIAAAKSYLRAKDLEMGVCSRAVLLGCVMLHSLQIYPVRSPTMHQWIQAEDPLEEKPSFQDYRIMFYLFARRNYGAVHPLSNGGQHREVEFSTMWTGLIFQDDPMSYLLKTLMHLEVRLKAWASQGKWKLIRGSIATFFRDVPLYPWWSVEVELTEHL
jgi:hypothetical protein